MLDIISDQPVKVVAVLIKHAYIYERVAKLSIYEVIDCTPDTTTTPTTNINTTTLATIIDNVTVDLIDFGLVTPPPQHLEEVVPPPYSQGGERYLCQKHFFESKNYSLQIVGSLVVVSSSYNLVDESIVVETYNIPCPDGTLQGPSQQDCQV